MIKFDKYIPKKVMGKMKSMVERIEEEYIGTFGQLNGIKTFRFSKNSIMVTVNKNGSINDIEIGLKVYKLNNRDTLKAIIEKMKLWDTNGIVEALIKSDDGRWYTITGNLNNDFGVTITQK